MSWDHCDLRFLSTYQTNQSTVTDKYRALPTYRLAFRWSIFDRHVTSRNAWTSSINVNLRFIPSYFKRSLVGFISIPTRQSNYKISTSGRDSLWAIVDFTTAITWESENTRSEDSVRHFPLVASSLSCFSCETYKRPQTEIKLSLYHFSKKFSLYYRTRKSKRTKSKLKALC